jgi:CheY-like chemotaxis protein
MAPTTVLVVDDEEKNQKLLRAVLSRENFEIVAASDGKAALASIDVRLPDLILLDVMMPGMNGFEVCRRLKQDARTQKIPVLMVTALKDKEDRIMALHAGADDFLSKPIDTTELIVRVKSLLRIKRYYDELIAKNREIHAKNIKLVELERLKESLFHMVIHDLRNPLMSIFGAVEILHRGPEELSPEQTALVNMCLRSCRELKGIIDSTLDIYRMEHGTLQLQREDRTAFPDEKPGQAPADDHFQRVRGMPSLRGSQHADPRRCQSVGQRHPPYSGGRPHPCFVKIEYVQPVAFGQRPRFRKRNPQAGPPQNLRTVRTTAPSAGRRPVGLLRAGPHLLQDGR